MSSLSYKNTFLLIFKDILKVEIENSEFWMFLKKYIVPADSREGFLWDDTFKHFDTYFGLKNKNNN